MVVYVFEFPGSWFKVGYTAHCPYQRLDRGFWGNIHPPELCGRLDDARLLYLFEDDEATEKALHSALAPDIGEFYGPGHLVEVVGLLELVLHPLPLPTPRPAVRTQPVVKRVCCGGPGGMRADHKARSFATKGQTELCEFFGKEISIRKDKKKQHQEGRECKRRRK